MGRGRGGAGQAKRDRTSEGYATASTEQEANQIFGEQTAAVLDQEAQDVIDEYINDNYYYINDRLRNGANERNSERSRARELEYMPSMTTDQSIAAMDRIMASSAAIVQRPFVAARAWGDGARSLLTMREGMVFADPGFVSTSALAGYRHDGAPVSSMVQIQVPKGARGIYVGSIGFGGGAETEFILNRGTSFRVVKAATATSPLVVEVVRKR